MIELQTDSVSWVDGADGLRLTIRTPRAREIVKEIEEGKRYTVQVKEFRNKRSLDANAYMWILVDKIAERLGVKKENVYRNEVRELGGNSDTVCILEKAADSLVEGWQHNGIGWIAEKYPSKIDGCVNVTLYYGSSTYDTKQMSRLIDNLITDAQALGIETMTPAELARLEGYGETRSH